MANTCFAQDYYVSKKGNDSNPGTKARPFLTIQKAASVMEAGDVCYVASGTYSETVRPVNSGLEGKPIVFRAENPDEEVVVTGANPIPHDQWTKVSENIFKANIALHLGHENQIFLNGKTMVEARWPNIGEDMLKPGMAVMDEGTTPEMIVCQELPAYDYSGANIWIHAPKYWTNWITEVLEYSEKTLTIENVAPYPGPRRHETDEGADFFIFGIKDALDADNEWYYDKEKKALYVYRSNGKLPEKEYLVKRRMQAFDFSGKKHLELHEFTLFGASVVTNKQTESVLINRVKVFYPYYSSRSSDGQGILMNGTGCTIRNSEVAYSSASGVVLNGKENKVINCYIHDTDFIGDFIGCVTLRGEGNIISHSTLTRSGRTVLAYDLYKSLVQHCEMSHSGLLTSDLGLSYGNIMEGGNSEVRYNLMHDNDDPHWDMGLYYDHGTQNIISHHNIVWGVGFTAFLINHYAAYHLVYNNTFIAEEHGFRSTWGNKASPDLLECRFANNLFRGDCETTAGNYYWSNNISGYKGFDENNPMRLPPEAKGKGIYIPNITASPKGVKPAIGAIEYEGMSFEVGHDFENPPENIDFTRSRPPGRNLIENSAFDRGDFFSPWQRNNQTVKPVKHDHQGQGDPETGIGRMGRHSIALTADGSEVFQEVKGLKPGHEYVFTGHMRVERGERVVLGVRFPDGTEFISPNVTFGAPEWRRSRLYFTVPQNISSAEVFARRLSKKGKTVYVDDFGLVLNQ